MKNTRTLKALSMILMLAMLMLSFPISAHAEDITTAATVVEVESMREEYAKHFLMPDGSYTAVVYSAPVHRKDENGNWQDIDNRMAEATVKNKQAYITADGRVVFSKKINAETPTVYTVNHNGYSITLAIDDATVKNTTANLSNHAQKYVPTGADSVETQYKKLKTIDNNTTVTYKNLWQGIDIEYVLSSNDIKENIIVRKAAEEYVYSFLYELTGLSATLNENGTVSLCDNETGALVCLIPAPYMYDDEGNVSDAVEYTLTDLGGSTYRMTVTADAEWINAEDRAFPVTIDPTIPFSAASQDTFVCSAAPDTVYGMSPELWVSNREITFMKYGALENIPDNATIHSATLNVYYYYHVTTGSMEMQLSFVTTEWSESTLNWNMINNYWFMSHPSGITTTATVSLPASSSITESSPGMASMDVTEFMQLWYAGMPYYGIALKRNSGTNESVILKAKEAGSNTEAYYEISYTIDTLPIENGTYYLMNDNYDLYMQPDNNSATPQTPSVELWAYDGDADQQWSIEYLHNGYYKISGSNNKALAAPSSAGGAISMLGFMPSDYSQHWQIISAGETTYRFLPKSSPNSYMVAGSGVYASDARPAELSSSQSNSAWHISDKRLYRVTVNSYYDKGYYVYYNESASTAENNIASYVQNVADRCYELLGLIIDTNNPTYYTSKADQCKGTVTTGNIDSVCTCTDNIEYQCTTLYNGAHTHFSNTYYADDNTLNVYWTGHWMRTSEEAVDENGNIEHNRCYTSTNYIYMMEREIYGSNDRIKNSEIILMHEILHKVGAPDHYHNAKEGVECDFPLCPTCHGGTRPNTCVMSVGRPEVSSATVICEDCMNDILSHIEQRP